MGSGPRSRRSSNVLVSEPLAMETGSITCFSWEEPGGGVLVPGTLIDTGIVYVVGFTQLPGSPLIRNVIVPVPFLGPDVTVKLNGPNPITGPGGATVTKPAGVTETLMAMVQSSYGLVMLKL